MRPRRARPLVDSTPAARTAAGRPGTSRIQRDVLARRDPVAGLHDEPAVEGVDDLVEIDADQPGAERGEQRLGDEPLDDALLGRRPRPLSRARPCRRSTRGRRQGRSPSGPDRLAEPDRPLEGRGLEHLRIGHADPHATRRSLADLGARRARWVSSAMSSSMNAGVTTGGAPSSAGKRMRSWRTIAISCSSVRG